MSGGLNTIMTDRLTRLKRSEGGDSFSITYTNGDISKVVQVDEDGDKDVYNIRYTNDEYKNVVANKGCIMLFDDFFGIDMDEMGMAYFAGLLGKATKNLPMGYTENTRAEIARILTKKLIIGNSTPITCLPNFGAETTNMIW